VRVSVIGTGYVGLVSGACLAEKGHHVTCVDSDGGKVDAIRRGQSPIFEAGLKEILRRNLGRRLHATTDLAQGVADSELTLIAVGTPFDGRRIDLSQLRDAATQVGRALRRKEGYHVVAVKSTVVPGTTDGVVRPLLEAGSGRQSGAGFGLGMNPEFLTEGVAVRDFLEPDRIVLGGIDERTHRVLEELYAAFPPGVPRIRTNNATAEMIKYASNAVLATLISFSNEIAGLCSALGGIDALEVMRGVHLAQYFTTPLEGDRRVVAPITAFLEAGCGFGGSCLPKDVRALVAHGGEHGVPMPLLGEVIATNERQPERLVALLRRHFPSIRGVRVTVLGLAFKPDTDDVRESPAFPVIRALLREGALVRAYDPEAMEKARASLPPAVELAPDLAAAVLGAEALLIVTRWDAFRAVPDLLRGVEPAPLVVDGRRLLERGSVPRYDGIGL
jgi:UDPglucose 6-dehydrogenase/GDP-mannose 6-dehydrogenase